MDEEEEKRKPKDRSKKRKPVSKRTQLKRRQDFDIRALSKGDAEETMKDVNPQWTRYYQGVLGVDEAQTMQRNVITPSQLFLFTVFWNLGFPPLPASMKRLLAVVQEEEEIATYSVPIKDLTAEMMEFLERENRLGRCTLKRSRTLVNAIHALQVERGSIVLDILADEESHELCVRSNSLVLLQRKTLPCFDSPSAVWQSTWTPNVPLQFDRILCRAPNTQDGTMPTRKEWTNWKTSNAKELCVLQLKITLELAQRYLKVGGKMCYVTQSINPLENDHVVADLIGLCQGTLRIVEQAHTPVGEPGGGGYFCVIEKLAEVEVNRNSAVAAILGDPAKMMQANDCLASLKIPSCLGTTVCIARHRPPKILEGPLVVERNVGLHRDLKLSEDEFEVLTSSTSRESYLCTQQVFDYYLLANDVTELIVRRYGMLLLVEPDAPLEQRALVHVRAGLNIALVQGEQSATQALRCALKPSHTIPFALLEVQSSSSVDENYYLLQLEYSDNDANQEHVASGGERISTAQRKRMKKAAAAAASGTSAKSEAVQRKCMLFGRVIFDEDDTKLILVSNDGDWLESCAHSMFSSL